MSDEQKSDFVRALKDFVLTRGERTPDGYGRIGYRPHRGELLLVAGIADFLRTSPHVVESEDGCNWFNYLPEWLDDAFEAMRTEREYKPLRDQYEIEAEHEVPSLVNWHEGGLARPLVAMQVVRLMPLLAYPNEARQRAWLQTHLESYVYAQDRAVEQAWQCFVRGPYRKLMPRIKEESHRGNKGHFGKTTLMTYAIAGRVMFTFTRDKGATRATISFVADDSDMHGHRSGANSTTTPFMDCISMIREVVDNWDIDKFARSEGIRLAGM